MKKISEIINQIFGWGIYLCLFAGGLSFFGFLAALIIGGGGEGSGLAIATFLQKQYFPIVIRVASFIILLGLVGMYLSGQHALTMETDKKDADADIELSKQLEQS